MWLTLMALACYVQMYESAKPPLIGKMTYGRKGAGKENSMEKHRNAAIPPLPLAKGFTLEGPGIENLMQKHRNAAIPPVPLQMQKHDRNALANLRLLMALDDVNVKTQADQHRNSVGGCVQNPIHDKKCALLISPSDSARAIKLNCGIKSIAATCCAQCEKLGFKV